MRHPNCFSLGSLGLILPLSTLVACSRTDPGATSCQSHEQCEQGKHCLAGFCKEGIAPCNRDPECRAEEFCDGGLCAARTAQSAECTTQEQCPGQYCKSTGVCVDCLSSDQCQGGAICRSDGTCGAQDAACTSNDSCAGLFCDLTRGNCVECLTSGHCPPTQSCRQNTCYEEATVCHSSTECAALGKVCDLATGRCVQCTSQEHCGLGRHCAANICVDDSQAGGCTSRDECQGQACYQGTCQRCTRDYMCADPTDAATGTTKICNASTGQCVDPQCQNFRQCEEGLICLLGRCTTCYYTSECPENEVCNPESGLCERSPGSLGTSCTADECRAGLLCLTLEGQDLCTQTCVGSGAGSSSDCPLGYACLDYNSGGYDGIKLCVSADTLPTDTAGQDFMQAPGTSCAGGNHCQTGTCLSGTGESTCARACMANRDCASGEICRALWQSMSPTGTHFCVASSVPTRKAAGESCHDGTECDSGICRGHCSAAERDCNASYQCIGFGGSCAGVCADHCRSNADCSGGNVCNPWPLDTSSLTEQYASWVPACEPRSANGARADGSYCTSFTQCASDWCIADVCTTMCALNEDCAGPLAGRSCVPVSFSELGTHSASFCL